MRFTNKNLIVFLVIGILIFSASLVDNVLASWTTGKYHSAYDFNGVDDVIYAGNVGNVQTVAFWIRAGSTTQKIMTLDGGTSYIQISGGTISAQGFTNPTIYVDAVVGSTIDTNWHHVEIITNTAIDANAVFLGKVYTGGTNYFFNGILDDVRLYAYPRIPDEIRLDYNGGFKARF